MERAEMSTKVLDHVVETIQADDSEREFSLPYYEYVLEFLANGPSVQEIVNYRPPLEAQRRFSDLLEVNRRRALTRQEDEELDHYVRIDRLMSLVKAKAYGRLAASKTT
jgi:hypothetical protein